MWQEIIKTAVGNGLWAVLFCVLLMYQLRDGRAREAKFTQTIDVLIERLQLLNSVSDDVRQTLAILRRRAGKKTACDADEQGEIAVKQVQRV